ncbi:MAG: HAMP domain-containing histidine kinase [Spirochaetia bacterium]|nr:HAMP domain-containing histidine kinase [Spirochaetia bacterium]
MKNISKFFQFNQSHNLESFFNLINALNIAIFSINNKQKIISLNKTAVEFFNFKLNKNFFEKPCYKIIYGYDSKCEFCPHDGTNEDIKKLAQSNYHYSNEILIEEPGEPVGLIKYFEINIFTSRVNNDEYLLIESLKDITKHREKEEESARNSKLIALGTLIQTVAHELTNPLTGMSLTLQSIEKNLQNKKLVPVNLLEKKIQLLKSDIENTSHIVSDIKRFNQKETYLLENISLYSVVSDTIKEIKRLHKNELKIIFKWNLKKNILIKGNHQKLRQIFINLFQNCIETTAHYKKTVWIISRKIYEPIFFEHKKDIEKLEIQFIDNGGGIKPNILKRIFDPYFTTKSNKSGHGLGLSLVQKIMDEHNASIEADSRGKYSRFKLIFPL